MTINVNVTIQVVAIQPTVQLPVEILLPMRLVAYNGGSRKLVIANPHAELPAPVVAWLQESTLYRSLLAEIGEVAPSGDKATGETFVL